MIPEKADGVQDFGLADSSDTEGKRISLESWLHQVRLCTVIFVCSVSNQPKCSLLFSRLRQSDLCISPGQGLMNVI